MSDDRSPAVSFRAVGKRFGPTRAVHPVELDIAAGTVHAFVGENGAGKSTLLGTLSGRVAPTEGEVLVHGRPIPAGDPRGCLRAGVAAVYQELTMVPGLSAQANAFLGNPVARFGVRDDRAMRAEYLRLRAQLGAGPDPGAPARDLSVADQQLVEIMRGLATGARVLLLDEPTAALSLPEREALLDLVRRLRASGLTIVVVSHDLDEVLAVADHVSVFREGHRVATRPAAEWTRAALVAAMLGDRPPTAAGPVGGAPPGEVLLRARGVALPGILRPVDLTVRRGEVVGIGGLVGSGRSTLLRCLAGAEPRATGTLELAGRRMPVPRSVRTARRAGIALLPEDRKGQGLVLGMSAADNVVLGDLPAVNRRGVRSPRRTRAAAREALDRFRFRLERVDEPAANFSGGNQQKLLVARWRFARPDLLLVDEPTRGIDLGAKAEIVAGLRELAAAGTAVLVVSSELDELVAVSERVYVLAGGELVAELDGGTAPLTGEAVLAAAFGTGAGGAA